MTAVICQTSNSEECRHLFLIWYFITSNFQIVCVLDATLWHFRNILESLSDTVWCSISSDCLCTNSAFSVILAVTTRRLWISQLHAGIIFPSMCFVRSFVRYTFEIFEHFWTNRWWDWLQNWWIDSLWNFPELINFWTHSAEFLPWSDLWLVC